MRWPRPLLWTLAMSVGTVAQFAAYAQDKTGHCQVVSDRSEIRFACPETESKTDFKVELPETAPPVTTLDGLGVPVAVALPEPPPETIVLSPADLASASVQQSAEPTATMVAVPLPDLPPDVVVVVPEERLASALPPPEAKPAPPMAPKEPEPATTVPQVEKPAPAAEKPAEDVRSAEMPPMPADVLKSAIQRLKAGNRITDVEAVSVATFYEARGFAPLWVDRGEWNSKAKAVRAHLAATGEDGLDPSRYRSVAAFVGAGEPQWHALAAAEAQLTESIVLYAREVSTGRIVPGSVNSLITPKLVRPVAQEVLAKLQDTADPAEVLKGFLPQHEGYRLLRARLAELRAEKPVVEQQPIPDGPVLRVGMRDPRVPLIRERLGLGYDAAPVYDRTVSIKVAELQKSAGLPINGVFTAQIRRVLSGEGPTAEEAEIIANMEFWRWLPRDLGADHVFVNVPAYGMSVHSNNRVIHEARVIVGKGATQTPFFSDMMDHIVVNPSWYVPPGILKKEPQYLDPAWASARGYEVRTRGNITTVRVPPSASNALGYVKFMFPNQHSVYLHDTPKRGLFNAPNRTLSNGCVRVENPFQLAALLFAAEGWTEERFKKLIGSGERHMKLPRKTPIHLAYFTITFDADGKLQRHPDVYGHSARLRQLLGLS